jgi:beta-galactosidase GanA
MASTTNPLPHLRATKNSAQLIVHGKPFLMLPAELHNSSLSSAEYMSTIWSKMKAMNINTLLGSITWEMIEPVEGQFEFDELDKVILGARQHDMHLILLWFGSYKNAKSTYVPGWVKKDVTRFPRVRILNDTHRLTPIDLLTPFNQKAWDADAKAFSTLMHHSKHVDEKNSTVLMVQVENEPGLLGDSRDRSSLAERAFKEPVSSDLLAYLRGKENLHSQFQRRWPNFHTDTSNHNQQHTWEGLFGLPLTNYSWPMHSLDTSPMSPQLERRRTISHCA